MLSRSGPARRAGAGRAGSTFLGVLALIAVFLTLAAVVTPGVVGTLELERVTRTASTLQRYERAIGNFYTHLSVRPGTVSQLTRHLVDSDRDSCGNTYTNPQLDPSKEVWLGPYVTRVVPSHGMIPVDIGALDDVLVRDPAVAQNKNHPGDLILMVEDVHEHDARALDRLMDGSVDLAAGKVRFGPADAEGFGTLQYRVPVIGC